MKYLIFFIFFLNILYAGFMNPSDKNYNVSESKTFDVVFPDEYSDEAFMTDFLAELLMYEYDSSFGFELDDRLSIILASSNNQVANAFASPILNNIAFFYGAGASEVDYFGYKSWLKTLLIHELAHTYQISAKDSKVSKGLHKVFGNNYLPIFPSFPIPLFTYPNSLLPTFAPEGNAVLNESRFKNGGRLYNGALKALFYALLKEDKLDAVRLKNDHIDFPYTEEKYIIGGYFFLYLTKKYGIDKTNRFFKTHSGHFINPLRFSNSFLMHFGVSYDETFLDFVDYFYQDAKALKYLEGETVAFSKKLVDMNRDENNIYFMSSDLVSKPAINIFDKKTKNLTEKSGSWSFGKPFLIDQKLYTASSMQTTIFTTEYGLVDEEMRFLPDSNSKYIMDIKDENLIYFDINNSFDEPRLYKNGEFIAKANSKAMMDENGAVFYFKQDDKKRILYKDKTALFTIDGYWSKIAEIKENKIYFIANTKYGSSLFCFDGDEIKRLSEADNIVDAKMIDNQTILAATIRGDGYHYMISQIKEMDELPFEATYFSELNLNIDFDKYDKKIIQKNNYNELASLKYTMLYPFISYSSDDDSIYEFNFLFSDPMLYNELSIGYFDFYGDKFLNGGYSNSRYFVDFGFGGIKKLEGELEENQKDYSVYGYLKVPLLHKGRKQSFVQFYGYTYDDDLNNYEDKNPLIASLHYQENEQYPLSFGVNKSIDAALYTKNDMGVNSYGVWLNAIESLPYETFIRAGAKYTKSQAQSVELLSYPDLRGDMTNFWLRGLDSEYCADAIGRIFFEGEKVVNINKYFMVFPVSLRRASFLLKHESVWLENSDYERTTIEEQTVSFNMELLFIHKFPFLSSIRYVKNSESIEEETIFFDIGAGF